jgi:hypothetical protein
MDTQQVEQAFRYAAQYNGSQCSHCGGNRTLGVVYMGVVVVTCEMCGGDSRKGFITPEVLAAVPPPPATRRR